jgi:hypothetical protein
MSSLSRVWREVSKRNASSYLYEIICLVMITPAIYPSPIEHNVPPRLDTDTDSWALNYIDVAHMQSIVEAIDEDCSGFITVSEANKFALSRPEGWRSVPTLAPLDS